MECVIISMVFLQFLNRDTNFLFAVLSWSLRLLVQVVSRFHGFTSNPFFLRRNTFFLRQYPMMPRVLRAVPCVVREWWLGGGCVVPVLIVGFFSLILYVAWAFILTCHPDPRFRVPARLLLPQGTGETSSTDYLWVGPRNSNFYAPVYRPPYLRKVSSLLSAMTLINL